MEAPLTKALFYTLTSLLVLLDDSYDPTEIHEVFRALNKLWQLFKKTALGRPPFSQPPARQLLDVAV